MSIQELFSIYQVNTDSPVSMSDFRWNVGQYLDAVLSMRTWRPGELEASSETYCGLTLWQCYQLCYVL